MNDNTADAALLKIQQHDLTLDFFESVMGLDTATAELMAKATADEFKFNSVRLTTKDGKSVLDPAVAESFRLKFPNIFKPAAEPKGSEPPPEVAPEIIAAALGGSMTARGQVFTALKLDAKDTTALAQLDAYLDAARIKAAKPEPVERERDQRGRFTAPPAKDVSAENPWSVEGWSLLKQMQVYRADPAKAASLAKAAGSSIGATKGMRAPLAPSLRRAAQ